MCKECGFCSEEDFEEEEVTKEELVEEAIDNIAEGGCLACTLDQMFEFGYLAGKQDLARESVEYYQDVLEEDDIDE